MIIDAHVHWWKKGFMVIDPGWPPFTAELANAYYVPYGINLNENELEQTFLDPDGSALLRRMDEAGIDISVLLPIDLGLIYGMEPPCDIISTNQEYARLAQENPKRLIAFFGIDPRREKAYDHFVSAVKDWGMKGLKLYPPTGFLPSDDCCQPFYQACLEHNLPVIFHCAVSALSPDHKSHPNNFKPVLEKYPELKIILGHAGGNDWLDPAVKLIPGEVVAGDWFTEAINLAENYKNVYVDISAWQIYDDAKITEYLQYIIKRLGSLDKVLFGSDYPIFYGAFSSQQWVSRIQRLDIPMNEKEKLMGNNAAALLGV